MDPKRHEKLAGEIFQQLIYCEDNVRLVIWIEMIENEIIRQRGYSDGAAAGSWVFDGNTSEISKAIVLKGIEDGDPAILDQLPHPRIGGEFADDPTWEDILKNEDIRWDPEQDSDGRADLLEVYEAAFQEGVTDAIVVNNR